MRTLSDQSHVEFESANSRAFDEVLITRHTAGRPADTTPAMDLADLLVAYLEQLGVEYVFGVPGGLIEPFFDALARSERRGGLRHLLARHETGAAFMADGYARETGKLGVCCATAGPGATNLITGVACAFDNSIPMLVLTGQTALPTFGRHALQESSCTGVNTLGMMANCTRFNTLVSHPTQFEPKLMVALQHALRAPRGPVHLSIPVDVFRSTPVAPAPALDLRTLLQPAALVDPGALARLRRRLSVAGRIVVLVGGACGEAIGAILQFADIVGAEIITTPDGKGLVSPCHPRYRGVFGFAGHESAEALVHDQAVDLVIAVGSSMGEWNCAGWSDSLLNPRLIHIDESELHLARTPMAGLHVRGHLPTVFNHLLAQLDRPGPAVRQARPQRDRGRSLQPRLAAPVLCESEARPLKPQRLMRELGRRFPANTRFLADAGNSVAWAIHYLHLESDGAEGEQHVSERTTGPRQAPGGWLRLTADFAPMGWAIGGAIGTAAANRAAPVVCITGDGSLLMNGQELSVAVAEGLSVVFVVLNDAALGMVKHGQRLAGAERTACLLPATDFAALARAMGAEGHVIESVEDLAAVDFAALCTRPGPTLLDVRIDPDEVPPMGTRMRVLATAFRK